MVVQQTKHKKKKGCEKQNTRFTQLIFPQIGNVGSLRGPAIPLKDDLAGHPVGMGFNGLGIQLSWL